VPMLYNWVIQGIISKIFLQGGPALSRQLAVFDGSPLANNLEAILIVSLEIPFMMA